MKLLKISNSRFLTATLDKMASLDTGSSHFQSFVRTMQRMIRVLINLSYESGKMTPFWNMTSLNSFSELCSFKLGEIKGFLKSCLAAFTYYSPKYAPETSRFDLTVLVRKIGKNDAMTPFFWKKMTLNPYIWKWMNLNRSLCLCI